MSDTTEIPNHFEQAVQMVIDRTEGNNLDLVLDAESGRDICVQMHHGLGQWLRNNWGLWESKNSLCQWFQNEHDITHADDMSSLILGEAVARMRGEIFDFVGAVERFHEHWKRYGD